MDIRILIIEAENRFRKNLYQCLQAKGFTVDKVTPKDDVVDIVAKEKVDVILLGIDGLGKEGLTLIRPLKTTSPATEIIIITDSNHMDLSIEAMDLGVFDDFLIPLDIDLLARRIREAVGQKDQHD